MSSDKEGELIFVDLKQRISAIARLNCPVSHHSGFRYYNAMLGFCRFLSEQYSVQNFASIEKEHVEAYLKEMTSREMQTSSIKMFLTAIRFFGISFDSTIASSQFFE